MEKKTLTSLAMITFLMTSTAVVAMEEETISVDVQPSSTIAVQLNDEEQGQPSSTVTAAPTGGGILSALNLFNYWPFTSTSTPSAIPPVEEGEKDGANIPSAAPAEVPGESSTAVAEILSEQAEEKEGLDLLRNSILLLSVEDRNIVFQAAESDDPEAIENARKTIDAAKASAAPSSAPAESLTPEWLLTRLWNKLWGTKPVVTPEVQMLVEEQK